MANRATPIPQQMAVSDATYFFVERCLQCQSDSAERAESFPSLTRPSRLSLSRCPLPHPAGIEAHRLCVPRTRHAQSVRT